MLYCVGLDVSCCGALKQYLQKAFYLSKNLIVSNKPLKNCHLKTKISGSEKQISTECLQCAVGK